MATLSAARRFTHTWCFPVIPEYKPFCLFHSRLKEQSPLIEDALISLQAWCFQGTRKDEVVAFLRQDATNTVTVVDTPYEPPAKKQKTDAFINDDDSD